MLIALAKSRSGRRASHQELSWSAASQLVTHVCPVYQVEGLVTVFMVAAILVNGCGVQGQNYVAWLQKSKMLVGGW